MAAAWFVRPWFDKLTMSGRTGTPRAPLTQPVLVVQADPERGGVLGDDAARRFAGSMARSRLHKLVGAPHAVHASHPSELADLILRFLANPPA